MLWMILGIKELRFSTKPNFIKIREASSKEFNRGYCC